MEVKESGKTSAARLMNSQGAEAANLSYKDREKELKKNETCSYCGKNGHSKRASPNSRKKNCSGYGHICTHCSKPHHFEKLYRSKANDTIYNKVTDSDDIQGAVFDTLCALTQQWKGRKMLTLDHHIYNAWSDTWIKCASKQQPLIKVTAHVSANDYVVLGCDIELTPRSTTVSGMADTACQSCLAGTSFLQCLGLSKGDLILVTMKMHAANSEGTKILGAMIARFSAKAVSGETFTTRLITYITDGANKLFLSREACIALGMISNNFPSIGEAVHEIPHSLCTDIAYGTDDNNETVATNKTGLTMTCEYLHCQLPLHPPNICHSLQPKITVESHRTTCSTTTNLVLSAPVSTSHYQ